MDFVAGHNGMVGSALVRHLRAAGNSEPITQTRRELDLTRQAEVEAFFADTKISTVYLAAARVGGIKANSESPADFIRENLQIQTNIIEAAHRAGVERLLFLGSSCIYPRLADQPIAEEALMTGPLEPTNDAYAVAKIAGIKMCEAYRRQHGSDFRSVMPTNLYGPGDNFDLETSHVLPALLRKFHEAAVQGEPLVQVWGSGKPRREFLHVDDMASACGHLMTIPEGVYWSAVSDHCSHVNVGCGSDISIAALAELMAATCGFSGRIEYDPSMPDGTPRKLLDVSRMSALGWNASITLEEGVRQTFDWMRKHWDEVS
ncbi:MAG: GDP-L-fucose synthase [Xanthomonadales bacterium]|jgi:GDP-L-fucose synthase|nr:GDP-L-fucose synthase [Xanthomonadales bacterium]MDH3923083.1 GDP-L-fucose synthase [Xanthomonadales bacterium]MDH3999928.1 GDP-L-fucose synthase [Xanthomonadales bacterium]